MNRRQLQKLGVPPKFAAAAIDALRNAASQDLGFGLKGKRAKELMQEVVRSPQTFLQDPIWGKLANEMLGYEPIELREPIAYQTWGDEIDPAAHAQMRDACRVPSAVGAALMPDAHVGYGLPIGGVLACENAVIPYAVGVDIACRMKLSVLDVPVESLADGREPYRQALEKGTRFGVGCEHKPKQSHDVMDADWSVTRITRERKDTAWKQLGTSGSGNHFVEFGVLTLPDRDDELGLEAGEYTALLSHSGSRGAGAAVCSTYSAIAQSRLPSELKQLGRLAWLDLDSEAGQEYWAAMNLMGEYAAANHAVIHRHVIADSRTRINLTRPIDATCFFVTLLTPVRQPAGQSSDGEHHGEHIGRNSHRTVQDTAVEIDVWIELAAHKIIVFQSHLFQVASDIKQRVGDTQFVQNLSGHLSQNCRARVEVLVDAMTKTHQAETTVFVFCFIHVLLIVVPVFVNHLQHFQDGLIGSTVQRSP